jgi:hypothetical protein
MPPNNLYRPASRTNYWLTRFKTKASKIWGKIPKQIKSLPFCSLKKTVYKYVDVCKSENRPCRAFLPYRICCF